MSKPVNKLNTHERQEYIQYPILGATILAAFPSLKEVANIILFHCEREDGKDSPIN